MAIWQPTEGSSPKFGAELGEVWSRGAGSNVVSCTPRPASKLERRQFQCWTTPGPWAQRWKHLTNAQRTAWEEYAAAHELYRLTGRPQIVPGQVHFETYWRQVKLFQGSNPSAPWNPPSPPAWQAGHQPFEPFTDQSQGMAFVCRTERANPIDFFVAAQPPLLGKQQLTRARLLPLGTLTLPAGSPGQLWTEPADAAVALFGEAALSSARQQWWMAWELSNGAPLPVLDPCNTPPPGPSPGPMCDGCPGLFLASYSDPEAGFPSLYVISNGNTPPCDWRGEANPDFSGQYVALIIFGSPGEWYLDQTIVTPGGPQTTRYGPNLSSCPAGDYDWDGGDKIYTWTLTA